MCILSEISLIKICFFLIRMRQIHFLHSNNFLVDVTFVILRLLFFVEFLGSSKTNLIRDSFASQIGCDLYGIRPEDLELLIEKGFWKGRSRHAEHLGSNTLAYVEAEGLAPLEVCLIGQRIFKTGQEVCLTPQEG